MGDLRAGLGHLLWSAEAAPRRRALLLAAGILALIGLLVAWKWRPRAKAPEPAVVGAAPISVDPRLAFATPYRNVRPEVKYVGNEACTRCHPRHAETYRAHPMGRSLAPVARATPVERYDATAKNPFEAQGFRYQVDRRGERVIHRETATDDQGRLIAAIEADVQFAVGSGTRGRTYVIDRDGYLFQSPITWYAEKADWDLSPGFDNLHHHFGRPVSTDCLFCHSNRVMEIADTQNRYHQPVFDGYAIGCERCHGPGELHVRRQEAKESYDAPDDTIVNPKHLEPTLREAVCQQCHLQGIGRILRRGRQAFEYRPGLPLHLFLAVFIQPPGTADTRFVGQVEQMYASRCSQASKGALGCISCHDPHHYPAVDERVAYYRKHCLQCHERQKPCSLPFPDRQQTSKDDNCVHCHMPAGESNIQHHSITDHRIPRRPADSAPAGSRGDELPMLLFHHDLLAAGDPDVVRDLGIALVDRVERYSPRERRWLGQLALPRLEIAVRADPSDVPAWDAKAHALWAVGDLTGAAADFDEALRQSPRREIALQWAAALAMESKRPEAAASYLERALTVNPWRHEFHSLMAEAQAQRGVWPAAYRECQEAIKLNPANVKAQQLLLEYYVQAGQMDQARTQLERLLGLHPPNAEGLRRWFASRVR